MITYKDQQRFWRKYISGVVKQSHFFGAWELPQKTRMPSFYDDEIQTIYRDFVEGRLDIKTKSTAKIIEHYQQTLGLEAVYCRTIEERRSFGRLLYLVRKRAERELAKRLAEELAKRLEEEEGQESTEVGETIDYDGNKEAATSDTMPKMQYCQPTVGAVKGLVHTTNDGLSSSRLEHFAFSYNHVDPYDNNYWDTMLFVRMPSGVVTKWEVHGSPGVYEFRGGPTQVTLRHHGVDGQSTSLSMRLPRSRLMLDSAGFRTFLNTYKNNAGGHRAHNNVIVVRSQAIIAANDSRINGTAGGNLEREVGPKT
jgi:hypothetical protein